jgi:hypothetical protein
MGQHVRPPPIRPCCAQWRRHTLPRSAPDLCPDRTILAYLLIHSSRHHLLLGPPQLAARRHTGHCGDAYTRTYAGTRIDRTGAYVCTCRCLVSLYEWQSADQKGLSLCVARGCHVRELAIHKTGRAVSLSRSEAFCARRYRDSILVARALRICGCGGMPSACAATDHEARVGVVRVGWIGQAPGYHHRGASKQTL